MKSISFLLFAFLFHSQTYAQWNKIINSTITFKIKNAGIWVKGSFTKSSIQVSFDEVNLAQSEFIGQIDANSIQTGIKLRDNHLRDKEEFFYVKKHPTLTMKSVLITRKSPGIYTVKWSLSMKGITRLFSSDVHTLQEGNALKFYTTFTINRNDWNIGGSSFTMGDYVTITLNTTVQK
ncbi:MAG: YceI family protein [Chitinophagaceae bacterium]|nr:YceI family protein [Chitinophagaceae bacterium]